MKSVYHVLQQAAKARPDQIALHDGDLVYTYGAFLNEVDRTAEALAEAGVGPGVGLGILGRNSSGYVAAAFAAWKLGATILPLSHQLKQAELDGIFRDVGLHTCVHDGHGPAIQAGGTSELTIANHPWTLHTLQQATEKPFTPIADAAYVRFTSGTTGAAKGVVISHQAILDRTDAANKGLLIQPADTVLWVLPMAYHFLVSLVLYLRYGATVVLCPTILARTVLDEITEHGATVFYGSPLHFRMLAADKSDTGLSTLRLAISTSSGIPSSVAAAFTKRYGVAVTQAYGIIEVGLPLLNTQSADTHPDAVGYPLPDFDVGILDDHGARLDCGQLGRLGLKGPGMFDAYLQPFTPRADVLENGWFMTGDLATESEDGLVTIRGREKSVINVSGNKVFPEEVEDVLLSHPAIHAARICGAAHPLTGEIVEADLVLKPDQTIDTEEVIDYCRSRLSTYKVPQRIRVVDELPTTDSGKLVRHAR